MDVLGGCFKKLVSSKQGELFIGTQECCKSTAHSRKTRLF